MNNSKQKFLRVLCVCVCSAAYSFCCWKLQHWQFSLFDATIMCMYCYVNMSLGFNAASMLSASQKSFSIFLSFTTNECNALKLCLNIHSKLIFFYLYRCTLCLNMKVNKFEEKNWISKIDWLRWPKVEDVFPVPNKYYRKIHNFAF